MQEKIQKIQSFLHISAIVNVIIQITHEAIFSFTWFQFIIHLFPYDVFQRPQITSKSLICTSLILITEKVIDYLAFFILMRYPHFRLIIIKSCVSAFF